MFHVEQLSTILTIINAGLTDKKVEDFQFFLTSLLEWNQKVNLISRKTEARAFEDHVIPSLAYGLFIDQDLSYVDIGSGAGLPGLVLKIAFPDLRIDLVDSNRKKILFCKYIIAELGLTGTNAILSRAESLEPAYDAAVFRSVATIEKLLAMAGPALKNGGFFLSLKGKQEPLTLQSSQVQILQIPQKLKQQTHRLADSVMLKVKTKQE